MPVTREISPQTHRMMFNWVNNPVYDNSESVNNYFHEITSIDDMLDKLQMALQVEMATIPIYLSALLSIKPDTNQDIFSYLKEVVNQEMTHVCNAANLIIALGGRPLVAS